MNKKIKKGLGLGVLAVAVVALGLVLRSLNNIYDLAWLAGLEKIMSVFSFIFFLPMIPIFLIVFYFAPQPTLTWHIFNFVFTFVCYFGIGYFWGDWKKVVKVEKIEKINKLQTFCLQWSYYFEVRDLKKEL